MKPISPPTFLSARRHHQCARPSGYIGKYMRAKQTKLYNYLMAAVNVLLWVRVDVLLLHDLGPLEGIGRVIRSIYCCVSSCEMSGGHTLSDCLQGCTVLSTSLNEYNPLLRELSGPRPLCWDKTTTKAG